MSQAIGDPDELDNFASSLTQFIDTLNESINRLNANFNTLGDTWQDEKRVQFEECFNTVVQQLSQFESIASEQVPYIHSLATRLRDYLQS